MHEWDTNRQLEIRGYEWDINHQWMFMMYEWDTNHQLKTGLQVRVGIGLIHHVSSTHHQTTQDPPTRLQTTGRVTMPMTTTPIWVLHSTLETAEYTPGLTTLCSKHVYNRLDKLVYEGGSWEGFVSQFETLVEKIDLTEREKIEHLQFAMKKDALEFYTSLQVDPARAKYSWLKDQLSTRYGRKTNPRL